LGNFVKLHVFKILDERLNGQVKERKEEIFGKNRQGS
jgi:hypothetical protein